MSASRICAPEKPECLYFAGKRFRRVHPEFFPDASNAVGKFFIVIHFPVHQRHFNDHFVGRAKTQEWFCHAFHVQVSLRRFDVLIKPRCFPETRRATDQVFSNFLGREPSPAQAFSCRRSR